MCKLICTDAKNPYLEDLRWVARLSNGQVVFRNDNIPGINPRNSWVRLKEYCELNTLYIESFKLQFRSHIINLPASAGYWFTYSILASPINTVHRWGVGTLEGNEISIEFYRVPELIVVETTKRSMEECKENLIVRL